MSMSLNLTITMLNMDGMPEETVILRKLSKINVMASVNSSHCHHVSLPVCVIIRLKIIMEVIQLVDGQTDVTRAHGVISSLHHFY